MKKIVYVFFIFVLCSQVVFGLVPVMTKNTALVGDEIPFVHKYGVFVGMVYAESHVIENMARYFPEFKKICNFLFNTNTQHFRISDRFFASFFTPEVVGYTINCVFISKLSEKKKKQLLSDKLQAMESKSSGKKKIRQFINNLFSLKGEYGDLFVLKLLYCYLYKKVDSREQLIPFYEQVCKGVDWEPPYVLSKSKWLNEKYDLKRLAKGSVNFSEGCDLQEVLTIGVIQNHKNPYMPNLVKYGSVKTDLYDYSDCFETTLRNMCNILAYDYKNGKFSIDFLQKSLKKFNFTQGIKNFYNKYGKIAASNIDELHLRWVEDVLKTNVPYVIYKNLVKDVEGVRRLITTGHFIFLPEDSDLLKGDVDSDGLYSVVINGMPCKGFTDKSLWKGYEIKAFSYNFAVILNYLLGLEIFDKTGIEKENFYKGLMTKFFEVVKDCECEYKFSKMGDYFNFFLDDGDKSFVVDIQNGHAAILPSSKSHGPITFKNRNRVKGEMISLGGSFKGCLLGLAFGLKGNSKFKGYFFDFDLAVDASVNRGKRVLVAKILKSSINLEKILPLIIKNFYIVPNDWHDYDSFIGVFKDYSSYKKLAVKEFSDRYRKLLEENMIRTSSIFFGIIEFPLLFNEIFTNCDNSKVMDILNKGDSGDFPPLVTVLSGFSCGYLALFKKCKSFIDFFNKRGLLLDVLTRKVNDSLSTEFFALFDDVNLPPVLLSLLDKQAGVFYKVVFCEKSKEVKSLLKKDDAITFIVRHILGKFFEEDLIIDEHANILKKLMSKDYGFGCYVLSEIILCLPWSSNKSKVVYNYVVNELKGLGVLRDAFIEKCGVAGRNVLQKSIINKKHDIAKVILKTLKDIGVVDSVILSKDKDGKNCFDLALSAKDKKIMVLLREYLSIPKSLEHLCFDLSSL